MSLQLQSTWSCGHTNNTTNEELKELKKQFQQLQWQMSAFMSRKIPANTRPEPRQTKPKQNTSHTPSRSAARPKPGYCFNCTEDGHISSSCNNPKRERKPKSCVTKEKTTSLGMPKPPSHHQKSQSPFQTPLCTAKGSDWYEEHGPNPNTAKQLQLPPR